MATAGTKPRSGRYRLHEPSKTPARRKIDHEATKGAFVGRTAIVNGEPTVVDRR